MKERLSGSMAIALWLALAACSTVEETQEPAGNPDAPLFTTMMERMVVGWLDMAAPERDCRDFPVCAAVDLPDVLQNVDLNEVGVMLAQEGVESRPIEGQLVRTGDDSAELWWIVPEAKAGKKSRWLAEIAPREAKKFTWADQPGQHMDLLFDGRRKIRYMYAHDTSTPERRDETYKPFHHVFDETGYKLLTKGPGGLYTHHRGIFIGWNRVTFQGEECDLWHMKGVCQRHEELLEASAGPAMARSKMRIAWTDKQGEALISEVREVMVFRQPDPTVLLLEFRTALTAVKGDLFLNGDPEHAGIQYRPHNDVADGDKEVKAVYLFHRDGIDAHKDKDLPWAGMSYGLNGKRYSVQHMNHPDNPKDTLYSAYRDYGRFGAFFTRELKADETLHLKYRIFVLAGDMPTREDMENRYAAFTAPPAVEVISDN